MAKQINIQAAINEVNFVCGHFCEKIENVPTTNKIVVHVDQKKDGYKTPPQFANFTMVSCYSKENMVLSHGIAPSTYAIATYEPKRGKFAI